MGAQVRIELEETARGVAPAAALAWWSDFREGRVDHAFFPGTRRRILARDEDRVTMEERVAPLGIPLMRERVTARREADAVRFEGVNTYGEFAGEYRFAAAPDGTRVALAADVRLRRGLAWSAPLARRVATALLAKDLREHLREMERDLGPADGGSRA